MPDRFWVGAGNWTTGNTANWSTTSGGSGGASVPTSADDVYFDANSGNCTVTVTGTNSRNLSFTGLGGLSNYAGTFTLSAASSIHGSLIFSSPMTVSSAGFTFNFIGAGSFTITTNGKLVQMNMAFNNALGNWSFVDAFTINASRTITATAGTITFTTSATLPTLTITGGTVNMNGTATVASSNNVNLSAGTLNINSPNVSLANAVGFGILLSSTGSLIINNDTVTNRVTVTGGTEFTITSGKTLTISGNSGSPTGTIASFDIQTIPTITSFLNSTIRFTNTSANSIVFAGNGLTYGTIWFSRGTSTGQNRITGSNTISNLVDTGTEAHNLRFADSSTQTITTSFNVNGSSAGKRIVLNSIGTVATFNLNYTGGGIIECNYLDVRNSLATPSTSPETWNAYGSVSSGTVTGWYIDDSRYWIGGTLTSGAYLWSNTANWSVSSGDVGGASVPTLNQGAIFDSNSGSNPVTITSGAVCSRFNCSNFSGTFIGSNTLSVYQDAILGSSFSTFTDVISLRPAATKTSYLNTNGVALNCQVTINAATNGTVILKDNLTTTSFINHFQGVFDTMFNMTSYNVTAAYYLNNQNNTTTLNMNASTFTMTSKSGGTFPNSGPFCWFASNNSFTLNAGTSSIVITDSTNTDIVFAGGGKTYNLVHFNRSGSSGIIGAFAFTPATIGNTYNEFRDTGSAAHSIQWSDLGQTFNIFNVNGSSSSARITLDKQAAIPNNYTFLSTNSGITTCNNIIVNRCTATPAKKFYASISNSTIGTNTTGWNDPTGSLTLLGVG